MSSVLGNTILTKSARAMILSHVQCYLMMFVFLSVSIRCLTKDKLKKRKHGKHIFLKQYAFQTKGSSAVGVSCESKLTGQS